MKVSIDRKTCVGCGVCVGISDEIFCMDYDSNKAGINNNEELTSKESKEKAIMAKDACPVEAIKITKV